MRFKISTWVRVKAWLYLKILNGLKLAWVRYKIYRLYRNIPAYSISKQYRLEHAPNNPDFIYGELDLSTFIYLLKIIPIKGQTKIIDLGCGDGKLLVAASLYFKKLSLTGIDLVPPLLKHATQIKGTIEPYLSKNRNRLTFIEANATQHTLSEYNVIYLNLGAVTESTWSQLYPRLQFLNPGTIVISCARKLGKPFTLIYQAKHTASWGHVMLYIYQA